MEWSDSSKLANRLENRKYFELREYQLVDDNISLRQCAACWRQVGATK
jgi:hypothetical protein